MLTKADRIKFFLCLRWTAWR